MEYLPGFKKVFFVSLGVCIIFFMILILTFYNSYYKNAFVIKINDTDINARYYSEFSELFFVTNVSEGYTRSYENSSELLMEIPKSDKYIFDFKECEIYNKYGNRESNDLINGSNSLKEVTNSKNQLKIERMNQVLYDGDIISDLSNIITEEGRYYFHIYNKSKRSSTPIARVNTMLTFNVLVVNNED